VQIDRTKPTVGTLDFAPGDSSIVLTAKNASDNANGSGLAEYVFFKNNVANDSSVRRVETTATTASATIPASIGRYLGQVVVYDKAGNSSTVTANPDARTKMYAYSVARQDTSASGTWSLQEISSKQITINYQCHYVYNSNNAWVSGDLVFVFCTHVGGGSACANRAPFGSIVQTCCWQPALHRGYRQWYNVRS